MSHSHTKQLKQLIAELQDLIDGDGRGLYFDSCTMKGHMIPDTNAAYDFGSAEYKIRHLFLSDNSLWVGDSHKVDVEGGKMKFRKRKGQRPAGMQNLLHDFIMETDALATPTLPISGGTVDVAAYQSADGVTQENERTAIITSAAGVLGINIGDLEQVAVSEWVAITQQISVSEAVHVVLGKTWSVANNAIEASGGGSELRFSDMWECANDLFDRTEDFDVELEGDGEASPQIDGVAGSFTVSNSFNHTNSTNGNENIEILSYQTDSYVGGRMTLHIKDNSGNSQIRELLFINDPDEGGSPQASINAQGTRTLGSSLMSGQTATITAGTGLVKIKIQTENQLNGTTFYGKILVELIATHHVL